MSTCQRVSKGPDTDDTSEGTIGFEANKRTFVYVLKHNYDNQGTDIKEAITTHSTHIEDSDYSLDIKFLKLFTLVHT